MDVICTPTPREGGKLAKVEDAAALALLRQLCDAGWSQDSGVWDLLPRSQLDAALGATGALIIAQYPKVYFRMKEMAPCLHWVPTPG